MSEIHITDEVVIYNDMGRGWAKGKMQPLWHRKVYHMWKDTWRRVYKNKYWFGSLIHPPFKYLSNYVKWIEEQPNFDEFCKTCDKVRWSVDKDSKYEGNKNYYPEYMTLMTCSENCKEKNNRNGNPIPKQSVIGIPLDNANKIILATSTKDVVKYGFDQCHISNCLAKTYKSHKRYKWFRVRYKHNKVYRIK